MRMCSVLLPRARQLHPMTVLSMLILGLMPMDAVSQGSCPTGCRCRIDTDAVMIDCEQGTSSNSLQTEIDQLLANQSLDRIRHLEIVNTPLISVPPTVCLMSALRSLIMSSNRLTMLPDNCLRNMSLLELIDVGNNSITEVQDGVFDGLGRLVTIRLNQNRIQTIGHNVFIKNFDSTNIREINFEQNLLNSVDPWPLILASVSNTRLFVGLSHNNISKFTNHINWQYQCQRTQLDINFDYNFIIHIRTWTRGWGVDSPTQLICLHRRQGIVITFRHNPFICDCTDYYIYRCLQVNQFTTFLSEPVCYAPDELRHLRLNRVDPIKLTCEVSKHCPPGCRCVDRPGNGTLHVNCEMNNLTAMPFFLPDLPKPHYTYKLEFSGSSGLSRIESRNYYVNTSIFDASNCRISDIDCDVWTHLMTVSFVNLRGNQLKQLPQSVSSLSPSNSTRLSLGDNPWDCSCDSRWIKNWLISIEDHLVDRDAIQCETPARLQHRSIVGIPDDEFCSDPAVKLTLVISFAASATLLSLVLFSIGLLHRCRYRLYTKWNFHPFDRDECVGEEMDYDVFLCCSSLDHDWAMELLAELETSHGYRVCYHDRDFLPGGYVFDNICRAIERSKRTVCLLTSHFTQSGFCLNEFQSALHRSISLRRNRVIILTTAEDPHQLLSADSDGHGAIQLHLRQCTYVVYGADGWLQRLMYALPVNKMGPDDNLVLRGDAPRNDDDVSLIPA